MGPADAAVGVCLEAKAAQKQQVQSEEQEAQEAPAWVTGGTQSVGT